MHKIIKKTFAVIMFFRNFVQDLNKVKKEYINYERKIKNQ